MLSAARANQRLRDLLRASGISQKALARMVRERSEREGTPIACDHTAVARWLAGTRPRPATTRLIVDVLSERLGRTLAFEDVGLACGEELPAGFGLGYAESNGEAIETVVRLWQLDDDEARVVHAEAAKPSSWGEAALAWLTRNRYPDMAATSKVRIGRPDIAAIQATVGLFASLDNQFGGGQARRPFIAFLRGELGPILRGTCDGRARGQLFKAVTEALLLSGWMSYDAGVHSLAQRYFVQALRFAQDADDDLLAGSVLDAMSHQANFLGFHREAARLARAALTGAGRTAPPALRAHFHLMEARALASAGDAAGTNRALAYAARAFDRRGHGPAIGWFDYFDDAEMNAELAHCFRDLGNGRLTAEHGALALSGVSARSDFFVTVAMATGRLKERQVEAACVLIDQAMKLGRSVRSARCQSYVREVRRELGPYRSHPHVLALEERHREHPLWAS